MHLSNQSGCRHFLSGADGRFEGEAERLCRDGEVEFPTEHRSCPGQLERRRAQITEPSFHQLDDCRWHQRRDGFAGQLVFGLEQFGEFDRKERIPLSAFVNRPNCCSVDPAIGQTGDELGRLALTKTL